MSQRRRRRQRRRHFRCRRREPMSAILLVDDVDVLLGRFAAFDWDRLRLSQKPSFLDEDEVTLYLRQGEDQNRVSYV